MPAHASKRFVRVQIHVAGTFPVPLRIALALAYLDILFAWYCLLHWDWHSLALFSSLCLFVRSSVFTVFTVFTAFHLWLERYGRDFAVGSCLCLLVSADFTYRKMIPPAMSWMWYVATRHNIITLLASVLPNRTANIRINALSVHPVSPGRGVKACLLYTSDAADD